MSLACSTRVRVRNMLPVQFYTCYMRSFNVSPDCMYGNTMIESTMIVRNDAKSGHGNHRQWQGQPPSNGNEHNQTATKASEKDKNSYPSIALTPYFYNPTTFP